MKTRAKGAAVFAQIFDHVGLLLWNDRRRLCDRDDRKYDEADDRNCEKLHDLRFSFRFETKFEHDPIRPLDPTGRAGGNRLGTDVTTSPASATQPNRTGLTGRDQVNRDREVALDTLTNHFVRRRTKLLVDALTK